jgi:hypothetical protein
MTDQISFRSAKAPVKCRGLSRIVLPDVTHSWKRRYDRRCLIGGTIIDNDNLIGLLRVPKHALQTAWKKSGVVISGDDDGSRDIHGDA